MVDSLKNDYAGFVDSTKQEHLFQDWLGQMLIRFRPLCLFSRAAVAAAAPVLCEIINSLSEEEEMSNKIAVVASRRPSLGPWSSSARRASLPFYWDPKHFLRGVIFPPRSSMLSVVYILLG